MHTQSQNKPKTFNYTFSAPQETGGSYILWQERSVDGAIRTTEDYHNARTAMHNSKECRAIENKRRGMLTYGVVILHDNKCSKGYTLSSLCTADTRDTHRHTGHWEGFMKYAVETGS
jgi:hypothetical protein